MNYSCVVTQPAPPQPGRVRMRSALSSPSAPTRHDPPRRGEVYLPDLLEGLFSQGILLHDDWAQLPQNLQEVLTRCGDLPTLIDQLEAAKLLTAYQAERLRAGKGHGLVLGNYRVV